jgi:hypothetical protein
MNNLSLLIYFAGVCDSFSGFVFLTCFCVIFYSAFISIANEKLFISNKFYLLIFLVIFNVFLPSKETVYAIAVSEYGEDLLKSKAVGKAEKALESWLDKQINNNSVSK